MTTKSYEEKSKYQEIKTGEPIIMTGGGTYVLTSDTYPLFNTLAQKYYNGIDFSLYTTDKGDYIYSKINDENKTFSATPFNKTTAGVTRGYRYLTIKDNGTFKPAKLCNVKGQNTPHIFKETYDTTGTMLTHDKAQGFLFLSLSHDLHKVDGKYGMVFDPSISQHFFKQDLRYLIIDKGCESNTYIQLQTIIIKELNLSDGNANLQSNYIELNTIRDKAEEAAAAAATATAAAATAAATAASKANKAGTIHSSTYCINTDEVIDHIKTCEETDRYRFAIYKEHLVALLNSRVAFLDPPLNLHLHLIWLNKKSARTMLLPKARLDSSPESILPSGCELDVDDLSKVCDFSDQLSNNMFRLGFIKYKDNQNYKPFENLINIGLYIDKNDKTFEINVSGLQSEWLGSKPNSKLDSVKINKSFQDGNSDLIQVEFITADPLKTYIMNLDTSLSETNLNKQLQYKPFVINVINKFGNNKQ
jgi:hypothetical protein